MNNPASIPATCVPCEVESHYGAWLITFDNGKSLLLQSDYDQAAFAAACGAVDAGERWDGKPSALPDPDQFYNLDPSDIHFCPDAYLDIAEGGDQ